MTKTTEEIAAIAGGLTKAQRRTVLSGQQPSGMGKWPVQNSLVEKKLAAVYPWRWTPLGLAVRAELQKAPKP